jgi:hypothetical protein
MSLSTDSDSVIQSMNLLSVKGNFVPLHAM